MTKEYWVCIVGPVELPSNRNGLDSPPRTAAIRAVQSIAKNTSDLECYSGWGVTNVEGIQKAWFEAPKIQRDLIDQISTLAEKLNKNKNKVLEDWLISNGVTLENYKEYYLNTYSDGTRPFCVNVKLFRWIDHRQVAELNYDIRLDVVD